MHTAEAIILSSRVSGEADELVSFYAKDFGKFVIKAKSAKKITTKQGNFLHGTAICRINFISGRAGYILSGIKSIRVYRGISDNLHASGFVISFFKLCDSILYGGQKDRKLWGLLVRVLEEAEQATLKKDAEYILWRMEKAWLLTLLAVLGLEPKKLNLNNVSAPVDLDKYIRKILQNKLERRIDFFGSRVLKATTASSFSPKNK